MLDTKNQQKNWLKEAAPTNISLPEGFQDSPTTWFKILSEGFQGQPKT